MKSSDRLTLSNILHQEGLRVASPSWRETSTGFVSEANLIGVDLVVSLDEIDSNRWGCTVRFSSCTIAQNFNASREVALKKALQEALVVLASSRQFLQDLQPDR